MSRITAFEEMAKDLGVERYAGETDLSFCIRSAYSASRFWTAAFCMDDGQDGTRGVTPQALGRRLGCWISSLDRVMPGVGRWFEADGGSGAYIVYGRLVDIGDILPAGKGGRYVARAMAVRPVASAGALALGFFEPRTCELPSVAVTSGLVSFMPGAFGAPEHHLPWWETDCPFMSWNKASDYGELQYVNLSAKRWGLTSSESWGQEWQGDRSLTLARQINLMTGKNSYLVIRRSSGRELASQIDRHMAQELLLHLKGGSGRPITINFKKLDCLHYKAYIPISVLPSQIASFIDAMSWPVSSVASNGDRIFRVETIAAVKELLALYEIDAFESETRFRANGR